MWVRTFLASDSLHIAKGAFPHPIYSVLLLRWDGDFVEFRFARTDNWLPPSFDASTKHWDWGEAAMTYNSGYPSPQGVTSWIWWDHYIDHQTYRLPNEVWRIQVRPWLLIIPPAILPAISLTRYTRRRRVLRQGLCRTCGYDLRATPGRCPECGTPGPTFHTGTPNRSQKVSDTSARSGLM
jgi:hypothetical protein